MVYGVVAAIKTKTNHCKKLRKKNGDRLTADKQVIQILDERLVSNFGKVKVLRRLLLFYIIHLDFILKLQSVFISLF